MTREQIESLTGKDLDRATILAVFGREFTISLVPCSMNMAFQVVDEMRRQGWFVRIADAIEVSEWIVEFVSPERPDASAMNASLPVAICRAALLAMVAKEPT